MQQQPDGTRAPTRPIPILCGSQVQHVGDAVAFIVADSRALAQDAAELIEVGYRDFIVLDVSGVGTDNGVSTIELCRDIRRLLPTGRIITGGGVRCIADLELLRGEGIDGALVASALHQGRLTATELAALSRDD